MEPRSPRRYAINSARPSADPPQQRLVFFLGGEALRERQGLTVVSTVPTAAQKSSDFGNILLYDPFSISPAFTRLPFPNNRIPASMIPAPSRNLVALYPDPNLPGAADNYRFTPGLYQQRH